MELQAFPSAGVAILLAVGFCGLLTAVSVLIGPKSPSAIKNNTFECGSDPIGSPRGLFSIKFYHIALLFLVFDIEAAFMYPWAVLYTKLSTNAAGGVSLLGFIEMFLFVAIVTAALAYLWRKKALGWESN